MISFPRRSFAFLTLVNNGKGAFGRRESVGRINKRHHQKKDSLSLARGRAGRAGKEPLMDLSAANVGRGGNQSLSLSICARAESQNEMPEIGAGQLRDVDLIGRLCDDPIDFLFN